jgi:hypothetical protein
VVTWLAVGVFAGFAGAFWLLYEEKQRLAAENRMWIAENQRLLIERGGRNQSAASATPAAAAPPVAPAPRSVPVAPVAPAPTPAPVSVPRAGAVRKPPAWGATPRPAAGQPFPPIPRPGGGDFLPRR